MRGEEPRGGGEDAVRGALTGFGRNARVSFDKSKFLTKTFRYVALLPA